MIVTLAFVSNGSVVSDHKNVSLARLTTCHEDVGRIVFRNFEHVPPALNCGMAPYSEPERLTFLYHKIRHALAAGFSD